MKLIRQLCAVTLLTLTLAVSAMAGEIGTPGSSSPPPDPVKPASAGTVAPIGGTALSDILAGNAFCLLLEVLL